MRRWLAVLACALVLPHGGARAAEDNGYLSHTGLRLRPRLSVTADGSVTVGGDVSWSQQFVSASDRKLKAIWPYLDASFTLEHGVTYLHGGLEGYFSTDYRGMLRRAWHWGLGVETEQQLSNPLIMGEVGYEAWVVPPWTREGVDAARSSNYQMNFGVSTEAGYKANTFTAVTDLSSEPPDTFVWRAKAEAGLQLRPSLGTPIVIEGLATGWYDIMNDDFYHQIDAGVRWYVGRRLWVDLYRYHNGFGAPTFNSGDQHNVGVTLEF